MRRQIIVLGAGSFAREVTDLAGDLCWDVVAYVVNADGKHQCAPVVHVLEWPQRAYPAMPPCLVGLISPLRACLVEEMRERGFSLTRLVHPSSSVSLQADVFDGAVVSRLAVVASGAVVGTGAIVNRGATVGHDCVLGQCSTVGPGANLAGGVSVASGAVVGMGANVREGVTIGAGAVVGMGAVVLEDVPAGETWVGIPARRLR